MLIKENHTRLAILFHRVGPYHFARVRAAGQVVDTMLVEVFGGDEVYDWDPVIGADGFKRVTLFERHPQSSRRLIRGIQTALDSCRPDLVAIPGWSDAVAFSAVKWSIAHKVPIIMMSESTEWDEPRQFWKEWIKRRLIRLCAAGFVGGQPHVEYLVRLGMDISRISQGYDTVDNDYYIAKTDEARSYGSQLRMKLNLPEKYFLASARFVEKKNLFRLIKAYGCYRKLVGELETANERAEIWNLVLLGDGPLKPELRSLIARLELQQFVLLLGFKQYNDLPSYYGLAKAFIHASTVEQWGLVVNEAMASGLPVLVSNRCGCAQDLVQAGINGFTFDPYEVNKLADLMVQLSTPGVDLAQMGQASRRIILQWCPEHFARGIAKAVKTAMEIPPPRPTLLDRLLLTLLLMK
jgi:glycosyltransferase involved in cell wall biosynthesis